MDLRRYQTAKQKVEDLQRKHDQAKGGYSQLLLQLKEFGVKDVKEAKRMLLKLRAEKGEMERKFEELFSAFDKKFGHLLEE